MAFRKCLALSAGSIDSIQHTYHRLAVPYRLRQFQGRMCSKFIPSQLNSPYFLFEHSGFLSSSGGWRGVATESGGENEGPTANQAKQDAPVMDAAWPSEAWSDVAMEIFHQLNAGTEDGEWRRYPGFLRTGDRRYFTRNILEPGKGFEYAVFVNNKEQRATSVCQFGPYLEAGPGHVHGGAVAAILDDSIGMCANDVMGGINMTASLNVKYKRPIRLGSTTLLHIKVDKIEGRKCYLSAYVTSADGRSILCEATALYIKPSPEQMEELKKHMSQDSTWHIHEGKITWDFKT